MIQKVGSNACGPPNSLMAVKKNKIKLRRSLLHQPKALAQKPPNVDEFCVSDFVEHQQKAVE